MLSFEKAGSERKFIPVSSFPVTFHSMAQSGLGVGWGQSSVVLNPKTLAESRIHHPLRA